MIRYISWKSPRESRYASPLPLQDKQQGLCHYQQMCILNQSPYYFTRQGLVIDEGPTYWTIGTGIIDQMRRLAHQSFWLLY